MRTRMTPWPSRRIPAGGDGWIHVVDLDAGAGPDAPPHTTAIESIVAASGHGSPSRSQAATEERSPPHPGGRGGACCRRDGRHLADLRHSRETPCRGSAARRTAIGGGQIDRSAMVERSATWSNRRRRRCHRRGIRPQGVGRETFEVTAIDPMAYLVRPVGRHERLSSAFASPGEPISGIDARDIRRQGGRLSRRHHRPNSTRGLSS